MSFYKEFEKEHPGSDLTRVSDFTTSMVGDRSDQKLKTKGAETWGVTLFLIDQLRHSSIDFADRDRLLKAGECLKRIVTIWKSNDWTLPRDLANEALNNMLIHIELMRPFETYQPKHHLMIHPLAETPIKGNPWFYGSWLDESLNKVLKAAVSYTHLTLPTTGSV